MTESAEHRVWRRIRNYCLNPNIPNYKNYGGRGIKVCSRWLNSYQHFIDDLGHKPSKEHQLDRINNDGDYTPENCRWVLPHVNMSNQRKSKWWFVNNVCFNSLREAANFHGVVKQTIKNWCEGTKTTPPKNNCYSQKRY